MVAAKLDLVGDRAIEQGSYYGLTIYYPGNLTGSVVKGVFKDHLGGVVVATFRMLPILFNTETGKSLIHLYLTANDTRRIKTADNNLIYDCLLYIPEVLESPVRLIRGIGELSPGVTDA